jgi:hypothetical protein
MMKIRENWMMIYLTSKIIRESGWFFLPSSIYDGKAGLLKTYSKKIKYWMNNIIEENLLKLQK